MLSKKLKIMKNQYAISESKLNIYKNFFLKKKRGLFFHKKNHILYKKSKRIFWFFFYLHLYVYVLREMGNE